MSKKRIYGLDRNQIGRLLSLGTAGAGEAKSGSASSESVCIEHPGTWIGRYKLLRVLGEGGMGMVYLAEQEGAIRRTVALKVIKPGMDSKRVIARFDAERQALAILDHPNIAHVYDAGTTDSGRPYFVMEYVEGLPITEHCDRHKLSIEDRLRLFQQVCLAIHHAHQKGIIHRDIKPSNILVSIQDGRTVPKIIDFGVAKAVAQPLTDRTLYTERGQLFGTPEYMSPEQADMVNEDIDIRSDVYSLGVLLYVLLTGVLPFDSESFREGGIEHIRQVVRETDPKTPSTRLSSLGDQAQEMAESRRTEISSLVKCLHRELEWIPLKAMRKDRTERYQSASELADDIESYLKGAALTAGPPSTVYRLKKFVLRNRALVTAIAAVVAVSIAGTVVSTAFALRAARQAKTSQAISDFLVNDLLGSVDPVGGTKREITVESLLGAASEGLEDKFTGKPLVEATIRWTIGRTYFNLGSFEAAEPNLKRAIELRRGWLGSSDLQTLQWMMWLGWYYMSYSRYDEAESILGETVERMRRILNEEDWNLLEAISRLAWVYWVQGSLDEAERLQAGALEVVQRKLGPEHAYAPNHMEGLAAVYYKQGRFEDALKLGRKALEISRRHHGEIQGETANISRTLADWCTELGRYSEAEDLYLSALDDRRQICGEEHRYTLQVLGDLGSLYRKMGDYDKAQKYLNQEFETHLRLFGYEDQGTLNSMFRVAELYIDRGQYEKAEQLLLKAEETAHRVFSNNREITDKSINQLIKLYEAWDKPEETAEWRAGLPRRDDTEE